jgi:hypothetical protein
LLSSPDLTESIYVEDLTLADVVSTFPGLAPWLVGAAVAFWLVNQYFAVVTAKPDARSLRELKRAREATDLAVPGTPEHQLLARLQRDAGIEHAVRSHVPTPKSSWAAIILVTIVGFAQSMVSPDRTIVFAWLISSALPVGTLIATQLEIRRERNLFREYCRQNSLTGDVEKLISAIKDEARSTTPNWALRPLDNWRSRPSKWLQIRGLGHDTSPRTPAAAAVAEERT